jgi:hypothetical protein
MVVLCFCASVACERSQCKWVRSVQGVDVTGDLQERLRRRQGTARSAYNKATPREPCDKSGQPRSSQAEPSPLSVLDHKAREKKKGTCGGRGQRRALSTRAHRRSKRGPLGPPSSAQRLSPNQAEHNTSA